jgi:lysophospholipase L1-like esterase
MTSSFDHRAAVRVCFFGDSFVNGTGDDTCLGWVGRVCAASRQSGLDLTCYNLGIRRDTSEDIRSRWRHEAVARLPSIHDGRLVFSFGANDCCLSADGSQPRVPHDHAVANAQEILSAAHSWRPTLMVGPLPVCNPAADVRIAALSAAFAPVCASLGVPYLEVFHLAANCSAWAHEVASGDGAHPNARGYTVISDAIRQWAPWQAWNGW